MASASKRRPAAPRPYHHGNLRQALLEAAEVLLERHGADGLTLRAVAQQAGVSHTAPYHHFEGLADLLAALAERAFVALADEMGSVPDGAAPGERLEAICETYVAFARRRPAQFRLMFGPLLARKRTYPGLRAAADRAFDALLRAARARDGANADILALTGWSLAHGLANLAIDDVLADLPVPVAEPSAMARRMAAMLLAQWPKARAKS